MFLINYKYFKQMYTVKKRTNNRIIFNFKNEKNSIRYRNYRLRP